MPATRWNMHGRLQRIEDVVDVALRPDGTREEAIRWTRRFMADDPRHAALIKQISDWGRTYRMEWIGPWRDVDDVHAGDYMRACFHLTRRLLKTKDWSPPREMQHLAAPFLLEYASRLAEYQHRTQDIFPLDDHSSLVCDLCDKEFLETVLKMARFVIARNEQGSQMPCT